MNLTRYTDEHRAQWDAFVADSKNATFLFLRDYMDYHRDRFPDHSFLVHDAKDRLIALIPGHVKDGVYHSHGGLTYGGVLCGAAMTTPVMVTLFDIWLTHLKEAGVTALAYKCIPAIYHGAPAQEDRYALFLARARLSRRDVFSVVGQPRCVKVQERRRRGVKKALKAGVSVRRSEDFAAYWPVLTQTLAHQHGVRPVHALEEIQLLAGRLPGHIKLHAAFMEDRLVAGVVVYETPRVARSQYIAAGAEGRDLGALDAVFDHLLNAVYPEHPWFDFGPSNEDAGRALNLGLVEQKEGFGARTVTHDFYDVDLTTFTPGSLTGALR